MVRAGLSVSQRQGSDNATAAIDSALDWRCSVPRPSLSVPMRSDRLLPTAPMLLCRCARIETGGAARGVTHRRFQVEVAVPAPNRSITAVPGLTAAHATSASGVTGCTVLLGPFRGAVDVRGLATGTREIETLSPLHLVPEVDAVVLAGGSAPGLAAADGVVAWLRDRGRGFAVGRARIPIVPAAVIFDVRAADDRAPDAALGRAACDAASSEPLPEGRVGAGAGATVGKLLGPAHAAPGGVGTHALAYRGYSIAALAVVNAFGDVLAHDGRIVAGARGADGEPIDSMRTLLETARAASGPAGSTTLCVVATDAPLSRSALQILARAGSSAIVRRIAPANTIFDGDVVFALSTAAHVEELAPTELLAVGTAAQLVLEEAILRAVQVPF
jgi:L-aminopeptidase/D-esterase-like protein